MRRRHFVLLALAVALVGCVGIVTNALKLITNLVRAFVNVSAQLPVIPGLSPTLIATIKQYLEQAEQLLAGITDTLGDASKTDAQKVLALITAVLDILAPLAIATPPFNAIIAAARVMIPIIAGLFGIAAPAQSRALVAAEDRYAPLSQMEAEDVLARFAAGGQ